MSDPKLRVGGTLDPSQDVYVIRPDDDKVMNFLLAGEYVAILTSRQMGKSSLMNKVARQLVAEGWLTAMVDLTVLGSTSDGPTYYKELMQELARKLPPNITTAPDGIETTGSSRAFISFIERLSKAAGTSRVAIFLDEIDSTLKLPYTDDLFTSIRAIYNERQVSGKSGNVVFCLVGVAMPDELVKDKRTTPYNIGQNIELDDFDEERDDLTVLRAALSSNQQVAAPLLKRILHWTGGQPYLTAKLISGVRDLKPSLPDDIDRYIETTYGTLESATAQDVHFRYILRFIEERWNANGSAVALYGRILKSHGERDRATTAHAELKLAGLVKRDRSGMLHVRNRLYEQLFDTAWINRSLPKRQIVVYRRAAIVGGLATLGVLVAFGLYRQVKVVPQQEQLNAREILAKLQVSISVVDGISWAKIPGGTDAPVNTHAALTQLGKAFPLGAGLGLDLSYSNFNRSQEFTQSDMNKAAELLPKMAGLDLGGTETTSIDFVARLSDLKILSLADNRFIHDFTPLASLAQLEQLNLYRTGCSSLKVIQGLSKLTNLSISRTQISDLSPLQSGSLKYFYATSTPVSDVSPLSKSAELIEVSLSSTQVHSISPLMNAENLEALFLTRTLSPVQDIDTIRHFSRLQTLSLNGQVVTRIDFLAALNRLDELLLRGIPFEDTGPLSGLLDLKKLDLSRTGIRALDDIRHMTNLQALDVSATHVRSVEPIAMLFQMVTLSLRDTAVSTLEPLIGMKELRGLDISGCDAVDLNQLRAFPSLKRVALDRDQLARLPSDLQELTRGSSVPISTEDINREFSFNLGTEWRNYHGGLTFWTGPLDQR
jgi:Leucine-rich repeat (LRR) protein